MSPARLFHILLSTLLPLLALGLLGERAIAQTDPPSRVARMNHLEGAAVFSPAGDNEWTDVVLNRPLTRGDRVWTDRGARADVQVGSSAVRMDGQTQLEILALDDRSAQLSVTQGTVYARVRSLPEGENFELDTPNLAFRAAYPGDYRIDVNAATGTTRVTIHSGTGAVYGESGQVLALGGGQQVTFRARDLSQMAAQESPPQDNFDRWAAERNRREEQSVSARYVPREVVGYQHLDAHGQWMQDADFGAVWLPQGLPANWAPYRKGHWDWIAPWGWTWIDDAPWGFAPFHYGRWATIDSRWAWVPGRIALKPVYSPALVAFMGGGSGVLDWSVVNGKQSVSWFPLAPGEAWQPGYPASPLYMSNLNGDATVQPNATYANQRKPEALTSISAEDFHRGHPDRAGWLRVAANTLTNARIVPPPPMPERVAVTRKPAVTRAAPAVESKPRVQAAATQSPAAPSIAALPSRPEQRAKADLQAKPTAAKAPEAPVVQTKAAETSAKAQEARRERPARRAEQGNPEQQAKLAEQNRRELAAKQAELARQTAQAQREQDRKQAREHAARELAKREQARRDVVARKAEQSRRGEQARKEAIAKREEQTRREAFAKREQKAQAQAVAKREEQARREAVAQREEQQRREAHARQVELARRAADREAQALREQRQEREEMLARREAQEREMAQQREQAQRAAWARQQQALGEQWRRDHEAWEQQQQRARARQRPDLRDDRRYRAPEPQRGIPIISGPWS